MLDSYEIIWNDSDYPTLVIADSFENAIKIAKKIENERNILSISRISKYSGRILIQED